MLNIQELEGIYEKMQYDYMNKKLEKEKLLEEQETLMTKNKEIVLQIDLKNKTSEFLRDLGAYAREQAKSQLESIITNALTFVFKEDISFKIEFEIKRGRPEAKFYIVNKYRNNTVENEPQDSRGGGVVDVVSIALRIALAECFGVQGPIIMDEPAKHLSKEYIPDFAEFIRLISQQFNRQIIMITHNSILAECGDIIYLVEKNDGVSKVKLQSKEAFEETMYGDQIRFSEEFEEEFEKELLKEE